MCRNDIIEDMSTVKLLDEKTRKRWTAIFVGVVVCIAITCISIMNIHYDELARYPYKDERSRELIKEYLNKEEIDYIIEYSIAPNVFISFIQADDFNIYHATEYKKLSEVMWMESPEHIVEMVEKTRNAMDIDTLARYLEHYTFSDIEAYLTASDVYSINSLLVEEANSIDVCLDDTHTVSTRIPNNLQDLTTEVASKYPVLVNERVQQPLVDLCSAINREYEDNNGCGGLFVKSGYTSYNSQESLYNDAEKQYGGEASYYVSKPGHDEHQLGLAVDFMVDGITDESFHLTIQYEWLQEHAWEFGFIQTYDSANTNHAEESYHYRYVGSAVSSYMHEQGINFETYNDLK